VVALVGEGAKMKVVGASQMVSTRDMVAGNLFEKITENPIIKSILGDNSVDVFSLKGFLCMEFFGGLTLYVIVYFLIQYSGAFCCEMEQKTVDLILSTPLTRRRLFVSRYLAWTTMDVVLLASWTLFIYLGVLALGETREVPFGDLVRIMASFLPFLLAVQGLCMLTSVITNQSRKAYGVAFGIYYGMYFLRIVSAISERLEFVKYLTVFYYWDFNAIFIQGVVPWASMAVLTSTAIGLFVAGIVVFQRKDLAS